MVLAAGDVRLPRHAKVGIGDQEPQLWRAARLIPLNDSKFLERAEIIREKGTNRSRFFRGEVDKYSWVDVGSSYVLGDLLAVFLLFLRN